MICFDILYISIGVLSILCAIRVLQMYDTIAVRRKKQRNRMRRKFNFGDKV